MLCFSYSPKSDMVGKLKIDGYKVRETFENPVGTLFLELFEAKQKVGEMRIGFFIGLLKIRGTDESLWRTVIL